MIGELEMTYAQRLTALPLIAAGAPALAQGAGYSPYDHPHMGGWGYDGYGMVLGPILTLLFLGLLVIGIIALLRWMGVTTVQSQSNAALEALNLRFAKGELDAKEYEERKRVLQG